MLDGIDYYPKKKKRIKLKLFLLVLLSAAAYGVWLYLDNMQTTAPTHSTSIIISEPKGEIEGNSVVIVIEKTQQLPAEVELSNPENLDEVIQTYEASSHD